jgi:hypothetical protein
MKKLLKIILQYFFRSQLGILLLCFYTKITIRSYLPYNQPLKKKNKRLIVLNHIRFENDLRPISKKTSLDFIIFPASLQSFLNVIGLNNKHRRDEYIKSSSTEVIEDRKRLNLFLQRYLRALQFFLKFDGFITCSFYYVQDQEWDKACLKVNIPFFAIYKENLKYETRKDFAKTLYNDRGYKFHGTKLFVFDYLSQQVLQGSHITHENDIVVTGMPRIDEVWNMWNHHPAHSPEDLKKRKCITLFSFRHAIGGTLTSDKSFKACFSLDGKNGVVQLFNQTHGAFAELALKFPDCDFIIKPKWDGIWVDYIEDAIKKTVNKSIREIPNLIVKSEFHVHDLILNSSAVVGLNSTTLLESVLLRRPTIIPFFEEISSRYADEVYFKQYFDSFLIASSLEDFKTKIASIIQNNSDTLPSLNPNLVKQYVGYFDGKNCSRFEEQILKNCGG